MKKETKEKVEKVLQKIDKFYNYIFVPFLFIMLFALFMILNKDSLSIVFTYVISSLFLLWIGVILYGILRSIEKNKVLWPILISIIFFIISLITLNVGECQTSNVCFILSVLLFELYTIYSIVYDIHNKTSKIWKVLLFGVLFIVVGYVVIYFSCYGFEDNVIFNALITAFSAIVGGSLTLGGVAWTIKKNEANRKLEEKNKNKPYLKNYLKTTLTDENISYSWVDINKKQNYQKQTFVLFLQNISQAIAIINGLVINNKFYHISNIILESGSKANIQVTFYDENISILQDIKIIASDIQQNYYAFEMKSENICEHCCVENIPIGLPVNIENPNEKVKDKIVE